MVACGDTTARGAGACCGGVPVPAVLAGGNPFNGAAAGAVAKGVAAFAGRTGTSPAPAAVFPFVYGTARAGAGFPPGTALLVAVLPAGDTGTACVCAKPTAPVKAIEAATAAHFLRADFMVCEKACFPLPSLDPTKSERLGVIYFG